MSVGYANGIRVMRMTHTGEPGFMLYIPIEVSTAGRGWGAAEGPSASLPRRSRLRERGCDVFTVFCRSRAFTWSKIKHL